MTICISVISVVTSLSFLIFIWVLPLFFFLKSSPKYMLIDYREIEEGGYREREGEEEEGEGGRGRRRRKEKEEEEARSEKHQ